MLQAVGCHEGEQNMSKNLLVCGRVRTIMQAAHLPQALPQTLLARSENPNTGTIVWVPVIMVRGMQPLELDRMLHKPIT